MTVDRVDDPPPRRELQRLRRLVALADAALTGGPRVREKARRLYLAEREDR